MGDNAPGTGKLRHFVWSPEGLTEPRILFSTHKQAMRAAYDMASKHPEQSFFVVRTVSRPIRAASVGAHPEGGDALAAPFMGDAVPKADAQTPAKSLNPGASS